MDWVASRSLGLAVSTLVNCSMADCAYCLFSGESAPGMYWLIYAVARYSRAVGNSGSSSTAFLKNSTASEYLVALKACTPRLRLSRALSFWHPDVRVTSAMSAAASTISLGRSEERRVG